MILRASYLCRILSHRRNRFYSCLNLIIQAGLRYLQMKGGLLLFGGGCPSKDGTGQTLFRRAICLFLPDVGLGAKAVRPEFDQAISTAPLNTHACPAIGCSLLHHYLRHPLWLSPVKTKSRMDIHNEPFPPPTAQSSCGPALARIAINRVRESQDSSAARAPSNCEGMTGTAY
jgi:hypothetical protein